MSESYRREVLEKITLAEPLTAPMVVLLVTFTVIFVLQMVVAPFQAFAVGYLAMDTGAFLANDR